MKSRILGPRGLRIAAAALIVTLAALPSALAANGRDFSASYHVSDVTTLDARHLSLTLSLRLNNHSGAEVSDARVLLNDNFLEFKTLGAFPSRVTLANHEVATLSGAFIVPASYVKQWRSGPGPRVFVSFIDAKGHSISRPVKLHFVPGVGG